MNTNDLIFIRKRQYSDMNAYHQALTIFKESAHLLSRTVRTWIYVKNIDRDYMDVVRARNEIFDEVGLIPDNHFITSTCVGGWELSHDELVHVNFLIADDETVGNATYMSNTKFMPPTTAYGVRFERGTKVEYDNATHWYVSGTASIDNKGNVVHNDVISQFNRAFENIDHLLKKYGADFEKDVSRLIVYYRNRNDYRILKQHAAWITELMEVKFRAAAICRPEWLVELECTAVREK